MASMIDQIRASKLPSNMMQFAARGALQVSAAENIEILVYLAKHNSVFGSTARLTLAGWDEKSSIVVAADPQSPREVLDYLINPDNIRPKLLSALLENPSISEAQIAKISIGAAKDAIEALLASPRVRSMKAVLQNLLANPYLEKAKADELRQSISAATAGPALASTTKTEAVIAVAPTAPLAAPAGSGETPLAAPNPDIPVGDAEEEAVVAAYLEVHAAEIAAEGDKPFQAIGGIMELLGEDYFPVSDSADAPAPEPAPPAAAPHAPKPAALKKEAPVGRESAVQKVNRLDIKGRIQLALKGNKEERSLLIRDGTKLVALSVLEAPKLSDGEVEKFATQKNVLESVLRQIPMKRRFMKNYKVVRNLVSNPRTPLDLSLTLMKHLLTADLKNVGSNKDVPETVRKLAMKMYKQKEEQAAKK